MHSLRLLADSMRMFNRYCVEGIEVTVKGIAASVQNSLMLVTALAPTIGYDKTAEIAHKAWHDGTSLLDACLALGYLSEQEFKAVVKPELMLGPKK
jgi:fumarate hydratase class II